ncbi:hypothetical protein JVU11DRAFT_9305 [Chiua virens]|nr:hypothetical protein JVU11DRAFT_9305 [Chiua virens]
MLPRDPFPEPEKRAKEQDGRELLIGVCHKRLRDANASSTSRSNQPPAAIQLYESLIITDDNDGDELRFTSQHSKGRRNLRREYAVANIEEVTDPTTEESASDWPMAHRDKLQKGKRKRDIPSDREETERAAKHCLMPARGVST